MQNPKIKLERAKWYRVASDISLHASKSTYSITLCLIPKNSVIMFLQYHTGTTRICKVMFQDMIGWITVGRKYRNHVHFFNKIVMDKL